MSFPSGHGILSVSVIYILPSFSRLFPKPKRDLYDPCHALAYHEYAEYEYLHIDRRIVLPQQLIAYHDTIIF
ncbi:MAG: hypothetical protein IK990_18085 [Ruminiclostridium sp.]|nr:hypothetical protein [Ruminiclostridium sp.]